MSGRTPARTLAPAFLANLLVLLALAYAGLLHAADADLYYLTVQEDEYLEWATVWAFLLAAGANLIAASSERRTTGRLPWFSLGVALFCFFVAMEEISWGQRLLGYRPPAYFLEHNFQQELNVHNVVASRYRKLALGGVIVGYGVVLPLMARLGAIGRLMQRASVAPPPLALVPAFLGTFVTYVWYPWGFSGEWVELMLGLGLLFAVLLKTPRAALAVAASWLIVLGLGTGTAVAWRVQRQRHPENVQVAKVEAAALGRDFQSGRLLTKCGLHKRLYTYMESYDQRYLHEGEFAQLTARGLPEARARFLLDPWNSPYWIRDACTKDRTRRRTFVYSFGPNRRRDSTAWAILGDDIGAFFGGLHPRTALPEPGEDADREDRP